MTDPSFDELIKIAARPIEPRPGLAARLAAGAMRRRERARRGATRRRVLTVAVGAAAVVLVIALAERQPGDAAVPPGRVATPTPVAAERAPVAPAGGDAERAELMEALAATEAHMRRLARMLTDAAAEAERLRHQLQAAERPAPRRDRIENRCDRNDPLCPLPLDERPERLTRHDLRRGMSRVRAAIADCGWSVAERTKVTVNVDIPPNGVPRILGVTGGERELQRCVAAAVGAARFRASQIGATVRYPLFVSPVL